MSNKNSSGTKIYETTNRAVIGREVVIKPSGRLDGVGVRFSKFKSVVMGAALKNKAYLSDNSLPLFGPDSKIYVNNRKSTKQVEHIYPDTTTFWNRIKKLRGNKSDKHIDLVVSVGHRVKSDVEENYEDTDFDYNSDFSEKVRSGNISEQSPEKMSRVITPGERRKRVAEKSYEQPSGKFVNRLYTDTNSPLYHGFCYEQGLAIQKHFCCKMWGNKPAWDYFTCGEDPGGWPTIAELELESFAKLPLSAEDKKIGYELHKPSNPNSRE